MKTEKYLIRPKQDVKLADLPTGRDKEVDKDEAVKRLMPDNLERMMALQEKLYAENRHALLIVLQAMDAAGKDGVIKHVMRGLNPQGVQVVAFKQPSSEELDHDYLWRIAKALPRRGEIGIFNRSHYEEVIGQDPQPGHPAADPAGAREGGHLETATARSTPLSAICLRMACRS